MPAGWTSRQALYKWDGEEEIDGTSNQVDLLGQPSVSKGVIAAAAPWKRDLAAYTSYTITWNAHYFGDHCPAKPNTRSTVTVGGEPGVLLAYNCGILVNYAATVHHGVAYRFAFVDRVVAAATDPTDHATFLNMLKSAKFSD
jgi:hypothetical protein